VAFSDLAHQNSFFFFFFLLLLLLLFLTIFVSLTGMLL
jgi:hypothetical protein